MSRLTILTLLSLTLATMIFIWKQKPSTIPAGKGLVVKKEWLKTNPNPRTPEFDRRPADQTFLTFPEWFLVFSPEEQANYYKTHTSTTFPFMSHVSQLWKSYRIMNAQIKEDFPVNTGYHFMIWVIASSTTVEYAGKALYENLIGRLTDTKSVVTDEDKFNTRFANDYVVFIKDRPWYEFNFKSQLKKLWALPGTGEFMFRKWERRFFLTSELLLKWGYGKLIGLGTQTVYDVALPTTAVVVDGVPPEFPSDKILKTFTDSTALIQLPRYDRFNPAAMDLARKGVEFIEIAGNNSAILITVLAPSNADFLLDNSQIIFTQPITSNPELKRIALVTPVSDLGGLLRNLDAQSIAVEHVFDY